MDRKPHMLFDLPLPKLNRKPPKKSLGISEEADEFIKDGIRTYGSGKVSVPMDAPKRPSNNYAWSDVSKQWVYLV